MRFFLVVIFFCIQIQAQDYYVYVAAESDDTVSLIKFNETETKEVFNIGIQKMAGQFEDTSQISKKKKSIARVKTMITKHKNEVSNA